jgi:hypothetical protein
MRIHSVALVAAGLLALPVAAGIPLGDLVRPKATTIAGTSAAPPPKPEVPNERNPAITQVSDTSSMTGNSPTWGTTSSPSSTPTPSSGLGAGQHIETTPGINLQNPGLPPTTASSQTVGGIPMPPASGTTQSPAPPSTTTLPGSGK